MKFFNFVLSAFVFMTVPMAACDGVRHDALSKPSAVTVYLEKDPALSPVSKELVRRAAFDMNGSSLRVLVADVDVERQKIEKLYSAKVDIDFKKDLAKNPEKKELSPEIQKFALLALKDLQKRIAPYQPEESAMVASDAFRSIGNGEKMLTTLSQKCHVPIHILSSQEKGPLEWSCPYKTVPLAC